MRVGSPPLEMGQEVWSGLRCGPGAACPRCHPMTDSQIRPLNKSGVQSSREAQSLQSDLESSACPKPHHMGDPHQLASPVALFHLAVDQARRHLPLAYFSPSTTFLSQLAKMGREGREVHMSTITGEEWEAARGQDLLEGVDDQMSHVLRTGT